MTALEVEPQPTAPLAPEIAPLDCTRHAKLDDDGLTRLHLLVDGIHCGGCIRKIETALQRQPGVREARVNMSTGRLVVAWAGSAGRATDLAGTVEALGFRVTPFDPVQKRAGEDRSEKELLIALAVAGFAAGNVMLLSVAIWAGHFQDMGPATRDLLHWFSALVALPAILYAGRPFYRSALAALRGGGLNMDVPISLAVLLAAAMSLFETITGGAHAYFDSAVTLLFFLLIGRYLDRRARGRARSAAERLLAMRGGAVTLLLPDGGRKSVPVEAVECGQRVLVAAGERIAVDAKVLDGRSEIDSSLITGESLPRPVQLGETVFAGTLNLAAPLTLEVTAVGEGTILAEIVRLMELAEQRRARYVVLADRVARLYAPVVHLLALVAFIGWLVIGGLAWQPALMIAIAVLIVTCPCALGLAVPAVQVIASGRLLRRGILLKSASALERMARADTIVFDKTGTLTLGRPSLIPEGQPDEALRLAAGLAAASRHPLAQAVARAAPKAEARTGVQEIPGCGLLLETPEGDIRLGSQRWCGVETEESDTTSGPELWLSRPGKEPLRFGFTDPPRADAAEVIRQLKAQGYRVELLSGDREETVAAVAGALGIETWRAASTPAEKCRRLEELEAEGRRTLMVGDGLNDAPALAAALVSVSPSSAVDISQTTADAVFQGEALAPVLELLRVARRAETLVKQNFGLAFAYNAIAVPLAILGLVTPLIAAICMSASSLLVTGNALRLVRGGRG
ncbi:MAG: heavy metal translocating P-type ATPase [Kiloniellales bacterium]|nr:heavy metal translocating P-type ATPase [Kiloniellales bacterium]MDJ0969433.1 heavy metal translocating P-type ATPase [Kiloniellales bacterium]MDJ0980794.1 heavy metal translocating P-type ATPase [Kiloniellales bacterium]